MNELSAVEIEPREYTIQTVEGEKTVDNNKANKIAKLVSALDTILERRRIVLGIGLPAAKRGKDDDDMERVKRAAGAEPVDAVIVPEHGDAGNK